MANRDYLPPKAAAAELGISEAEARELVKLGILSSIAVGKTGKHFRIPVEIARGELEEYAKYQAAQRRNGISIITVSSVENNNIVPIDSLSKRLLENSQPGKKTRKQLAREKAQG